jgi:hypothetical protein
MNNRTTIIQLLINKINAKSYLEIGVDNSTNFNNIRCEKKISVDPNINTDATFYLTSDDFFKQNNDQFDIIFIDGLHHADQVLRDIENSLKCLHNDGYIVCHDMNPIKEEHQIIPYQIGTWNGDCWKAFVHLKEKRPDLEMCVVDIDHGCGIIKKGQQDLLNITQELTFQNFTSNKKEWLNLISFNEFMEKYTYSKNNLSILINNYITDCENSDNNYNLALYYESIDQTASALSFFLRCAERTDIPELQYECLIKASQCFEKQGKRNFTVKGLLQHAISICPKRPEAYYFLSRFYEKENKDGTWQDSYMMASIGEKIVEPEVQPLHNSVGYPGSHGILFQKGVAAWWCGLVQESRDIFVRLLHDEKYIDPAIIQPCINNLQLMKTKPFINYNKAKYSLKTPFDNCDIITENYSEAFQDLFVLTMLNGKKNGTYLEIGGGDPVYGNNTMLLESLFNWKGVSIDIDENTVQNYNQTRTNKCFCKDATCINYDQFLSGLGYSKYIDYLQIDCDPPETTFNILLNLPLDKYQFGIITYEHDYYCDNTKSLQGKSSKYLESYGYVKVISNIAPDNHRNYEDWWIHPDHIEESRYSNLIDTTDTTKNSKRIFLKDLI